MPQAPSVAFYDYSCSLEEYCMNRESGFFKYTRFFHDIFHGYTHNCSPAGKIKVHEKSRAHNTSICEQFNSFLKKAIRKCAMNMTQIHFVFLTQFLVHEWNKMKRDKFRKDHLIYNPATSSD